MTPEEFRQLLQQHPRQIFIIREPESSILCRITELKELTKHLNFGCKFENNVCKRQREDDTLSRSCIYCCANCFYSIGYLRTIQEVDFDDMANLFCEGTGFWRKDIGCLLPRRLRAIICLTHHCNYEMDVWVLYKVLKEYEDEIVRKYGKKIK